MQDIKSMKVKVVELSTFNLGHFIGEYNKKRYVFKLQDKLLIDKVYESLNKEITIRAFRNSQTYFEVMELC